MYRIIAAILYLTAVPVTPSQHEIHKRMTHDQIQQVFGTTYDKIPKYEIGDVEEVSSMRKRDTRFSRSIKIRRGKRNTHLALERADEFLAGYETPVTIANISRNGIEYTDDPTIMPQVGTLLRDTSTGASLIMSQNRNGRSVFDGYIESENLVIRSLPEGLVDPSSNYSNHIMFKSMQQPFQSYSPHNHWYKTQQPRLPVSRDRGVVPETIYPELLLVVDAKSYGLHNSDKVLTVRYLLILWNSVNMRYESVRNPRIRINVARIVIATDPRATPYIEFSRMRRWGSRTVNADQVLDQSGDYFYSHQHVFPFDSYDAIVMMTGYELMHYNQPVTGLGAMGKACRTSPAKQKVLGTAVFHDDGSYFSSVPAHELGHVLGADDDHGHCSAADGYIMAPVIVPSIYNWQFSSCSISDIQKSIQRNPKCLGNVPKYAGYIMPITTVDKTMTHAQQCKLVTGTEPCRSRRKKDFCRTLTCANSNGLCAVYPGHTLAEGTPCDNGKKVCIRGECVIA